LDKCLKARARPCCRASRRNRTTLLCAPAGICGDHPYGRGFGAPAERGWHGQVHVLHRVGKEGLGGAYVAGFGWGLERGFDVLVEMDADGLHQREELPRLLSALEDNDLVIGFRWVRGKRVENWPKNREVLSRGANTYARLMLGISCVIRRAASAPTGPRRCRRSCGYRKPYPCPITYGSWRTADGRRTGAPR
jgi:glycosyltransferase involved in cell wall biosynthesis